MCLNFHPGPPEYPGFGCFNFAIYDESPVYGATCHKIDEKIDHGEIVGVKYFDMPTKPTVVEIQHLSHQAMAELFDGVISTIEQGGALEKCADWTKHVTTRTDFEALRRIPVDVSADELEKCIQAFAHPDFEGAYRTPWIQV